MIARLKVSGLKSADVDIDLGALNLAVGPVGSGKTTISNAISFLALGYVPALGKDIAATAKLMRGSRLEVEATLADGRVIRRSIAREGTKLTAAAFASWLPGKTTLRESGEAIRALFGESEVEAAQSIDLRELVSASPAKRAEAIDALLDASALSPALMAQRGAALTILRLADVDLARVPADVEEASAAAAGALALIPPALRAVGAEVAAALSTMLASAGLADAIEVSRSERNRLSAAVKEKATARTEIETRRADIAWTGASVADLDARQAAAATTRDTASAEIDAWNKAAKIEEGARVQIPSMLESVADAENAWNLAVADLPRADELRAEAAAIVDPPPVTPPPSIEVDPGELHDAEALEHEADQVAEQAEKIALPVIASAATEAAAVTMAERCHASAVKSPWRGVLEIAGELFRAFDEQLDPIPKPIILATQRLQALAEEHGGDIEACAAALKSARAALTKATKKAAESAAAFEAANAQRSRLLNEATKFRADASGIRDAANKTAKAANAAAVTAYHVANAEREKAIVANRRRRGDLETQAQLIGAAAGDAQVALDRARAQLAAAQARVDGIQSVGVDYPAAVARRDQAIEEIGRSSASLTVARNAEALKRELDAMIAEIEQAMASRDVYAAAFWACERLREEDLAARGAGIEGRMRAFLVGAGRPEVPFLRSGRGACDFGWRRPTGEEVPIETLSGGESAIFGAALASAIVSMRAPSIRCLLIEAAECGPGEPIAALLRGIEAVADGLDLVIVATNSPVEPSGAWVMHRPEVLEEVRA